MYFNTLTFSCLAVISLIFHKLFNNKFTTLISCISLLLMLTTHMHMELGITLMFLLLLLINFNNFRLTELLILSYILQTILILLICISSVNYWDFKDALASNTMEITGILILFTITFLYFKYNEIIFKLCTFLNNKETLFLTFLSWLLIFFIIHASTIEHYLDLYWVIHAFIIYLLGQLCCFYMFYWIEVKIIQQINKTYTTKASNTHDKEINELLNMKAEIARTYHELNNLKTLKDYYENNFITIEEKINTQNHVLNYILNQEIERLHKAGFQLKLTINFSAYPLMETETVLIFKNIFNNIHEHASSEGVVEIKIVEVKKTFIILSSNTIKTDRLNLKNNWQHGHGLAIIEETICSYNGYFNVQNNGSIYIIKLLIPLI